MAMGEKKHLVRSSLLACCTKCFTVSSSSRATIPPPSPESDAGKAPDSRPPGLKSNTPTERKPGGWKSMPFILGNETFERLATMGLLANFTVFLLTQFHMEQAQAANFVNLWSSVTNFAPLIGAFLSDAYFGKFPTIAFASFVSFLGMATMTLIVAIPRLLPPPCSTRQARLHQCKGPSVSQTGLLLFGLGLLTVGAGGIRPCSLPFGVDQFDPTTDDGRKGMTSFFNWYYATFTVVMVVALTVVVYVQDSVSWAWGFGIPTGLMFAAIVLFFVGTRMYVYVKPEGSVFSGIAQGLVAAYKKRKHELPRDGEVDGVFYDPPIKNRTYAITKLPLTNQFRFLNKAALVLDGEVNPDGSRVSPWRLASIQQIEEVKCLFKVIPVLASCIICFTAMAQQGTFTVSQALKMDRHLGSHFQIPAGSLSIISWLTLGIWIPFYDRILVPNLRKITKLEGGITLLQRIGIGVVFSILSMVVAGLVEKNRRNSAQLHNQPDGLAPMTVMWLAPQLVLMGFAEAFNIIGQIEFYYKEFPDHMKSVANSLFFVTAGGANYMSSVLVMTVHRFTKRNGRPDWLASDINQGRVDYFYYVIAGLGILNLIFFLIISSRYHYKTKMEIGEDTTSKNEE